MELKAALIQYQKAVNGAKNLVYARYTHREILPIVEYEVKAHCSLDHHERTQVLLSGFLKWINHINLAPVKNVQGYLRKAFRYKLID